MKTSQQQAILKTLEAGETLTPLTALNKFGCFRLGARICELRAQGHNITTDKQPTQSGGYFAEYSMRGIK
ncbi:helix-turn-helix domain-containing protein [Candidatus Persebacteraceae bacterium Df01]|jgi:hypothetical protein|uniref:Helix-turn-helix domain-containing protein n=1 Tax=Candidatus Doriopsillibacter californiensis TaxID=2970740 RepID=A0ABT7QMI8_9GAMM|nr:helix-turn-helix domain-containing protein [Candidatus Persebacteraceae bacterium Df01]